MTDDSGKTAAPPGNDMAVPISTASAAVSQDQRSTLLRMGEGPDAPCLVTLDAAGVDALISVLGAARARMLEPVDADIDFATVKYISAYDPLYQILPDTENKFATFWIRHPGLGWHGYGFPKHEAANIAKWLRKVVSVTLTSELHSPSATWFGDDKFLMSTEGLGFYYYGKGENRIGPNPFEQAEYDSDRAAAIVAGSIVELRLEQLLRSRLRNDLTLTATRLFQPAGPLGSFSSKIDLAHLMNFFSDAAAKDIVNIKNIRNGFAHKLELDSFDKPSVRDKCKNFTLVDKHVGPVPGMGPSRHSDVVSPYLGLPNYEQKLSDPRFRFAMTAQLISNCLGEASEGNSQPLPLI